MSREFGRRRDPEIHSPAVHSSENRHSRRGTPRGHVDKNQLQHLTATQKYQRHLELVVRVTAGFSPPDVTRKLDLESPTPPSLHLQVSGN